MASWIVTPTFNNLVSTVYYQIFKVLWHPEAYLQPNRTSMMAHFCENS